MKTLLGILASPRKLGNCELFVKECFCQFPASWQLKLIRLPDLDIRPCRGCYKCLFEEMKCPQKDDFYLVLKALIESDAYVVAAPTYLLGAHASLKRFLDRGLSLYAHVDELWGKPAIGVALAGTDGMEGYTKLVVESFIKLTMGDLRETAVIYGALPGEILLGNEGKKVARQLVEALLSGKKNNLDVPICPLCGGDTFRFLANNQARCMLCSNSGYYEWKENRPHFHIALGEHSFSLSKESVKRHADFLREMKKTFQDRRNELKVIMQRYTGQGTWIYPGENEMSK